MKLFRISTFFIIAATPSFAFAATCDTKGLCNPLGYNDLPTFLSRLLGIAAEIGFPIIVLSVVFVGFKYIAAQGKPEELKKIHPLFLWVVIGALIVLGAQALSLGIKATVDQLQSGDTNTTTSGGGGWGPTSNPPDTTTGGGW